MKSKTLVRCLKCKGRLYDLVEGGIVIGQVIKCPKCGCINKFVEVKYEPRYETRITSTENQIIVEIT